MVHSAILYEMVDCRLTTQHLSGICLGLLPRQLFFYIQLRRELFTIDMGNNREEEPLVHIIMIDMHLRMEIPHIRIPDRSARFFGICFHSLYLPLHVPIAKLM